MSESPFVQLVMVITIGYLFGSIPTAYIVAKAKGINIFEVGSKNPGATNVRRVLGPGPGNFVLALDIIKGASASGWPLFLVEPQYQLIVGITGVICGRAIYSGDLDFAAAQARADELTAEA
jgi:glycerol-3-phosphate acyltransferase PlsY